MNYEDIRRDKEILEYYERGNAILDTLGYTDHSTAHTCLVAKKAAGILEAFGYDEKMTELTIDENICTMYEYFDIFLQRMTM